jgi:hypothetical protein
MKIPATPLPWRADTIALSVTSAGNASYAANAYPQLVAALHNVHAALVENGAEANLANIISDAAALLASLGEQS